MVGICEPVTVSEPNLYFIILNVLLFINNCLNEAVDHISKLISEG